MTSIHIRSADLQNEHDCALMVRLTDAYASDPMGGGEGLPERAKQMLGPALSRHPALFAVVAELEGAPVGHALCILGFSTFYAAPVCNVHDIAVLPAARGRGVGGALMAAVEQQAIARGCAKLTLEVREDNHVGRGLYQSKGYQVSGLGGCAYLMMEKKVAA
jgi:ribosomal protein S18 acetylase RimI-like enzyme